MGAAEQGGRGAGDEERIGPFALPHRGNAWMEIGTPVNVGGPKPWLCMVRLYIRTGGAPKSERSPGRGFKSDTFERAERFEPDSESAEERSQTLLLRTGRGASPDEARRDALAQIALVYGSPVGPPPTPRIKPIDEGEDATRDDGGGVTDLPSKAPGTQGR